MQPRKEVSVVAEPERTESKLMSLLEWASKPLNWKVGKKKRMSVRWKIPLESKVFIPARGKMRKVMRPQTKEEKEVWRKKIKEARRVACEIKRISKMEEQEEERREGGDGYERCGD